jgi:ADP-ribose pyrophosphatase YjhB (NUDIX family)
MSTTKKVVCCNCGIEGHIYKKCLKPITSFGLICFFHDTYLHKNIKKDSWDSKIELYDNKNYNIKYLLVRRKDSLSFAEFVKAKYNLSNKKYIMKILKNITNDEYDFLINAKDGKEIWNKLWVTMNDSKTKNIEFKRATKKLNTLIKGTIDNQGEEYNLVSLLKEIKPERTYPEWGFPKGRRTPNETEIECSIREFTEETDIKKKDIIVFKNIKPLEEIFTGSNGITYRHIYYIAQLKNNTKIGINKKNIIQKSEIGDIKLFNKNDTLKKIEKKNKERILLFNKVNDYLEFILNNKEK